MKKLLLCLILLCSSTNIYSQYLTGIEDGYSSKSITNIVPVNGEIININLSTGWNTISSNIIPENPDIAAVFSDVENLVLVKNSTGAIYNPATNLNEIGNWNITDSYFVYVSAPATLQIIGTAVDPNEIEINLSSGWNLISYLRNTQMEINIALESINTSIILLKNNLGQLYYPAYGLNTIGNMQQGQGYWIYMNSNAVLVYP